ncbi:MAG TPA: hypothetical protein VI142_08935 [Gaiellaceae bacterium]
MIGLAGVYGEFRALRDEWLWRTVGQAALCAGLLVLAVILADSWRWLAAGLWITAFAFAVARLWPVPEEED